MTTSMSGLGLLAVLVSVLVPSTPGIGVAQDIGSRQKEAYFRAVADHFGLPLQEVSIVGDWDLDPDEVPVVLFVSRMAGVSSDVLVGFRRGGSSWMDVASRFGLDARSFHLDLPEGASLGVLTRAYEQFRVQQARDWARVRLQDAEIIALVNMRVLSKTTDVSPLQVLRAQEEAGNFVAAYARLRGEG
jgi:hypothetical protein